MCAPGNCPDSGPYFAIGVVLKIQELAGAHRVDDGCSEFEAIIVVLRATGRGKVRLRLQTRHSPDS